MAILPRQLLFYLGCGLVLACILMVMLAPLPARADVGPQPVLPGGSSIKPGEETPIQMTAETVIMNVRQATEADNTLVNLTPKAYALEYNTVWFPGIAEVEADFTMANPTSEALRMTVWFPLASARENVGWRSDRGQAPSIVNFRVSVDGIPVEHVISELPNPKGYDQPPLPWANFPVTFPGKTDTVIHVSYKAPLQPVRLSQLALAHLETAQEYPGRISPRLAGK